MKSKLGKSYSLSLKGKFDWNSRKYSFSEKNTGNTLPNGWCLGSLAWSCTFVSWKLENRAKQRRMIVFKELRGSSFPCAQLSIFASILKSFWSMLLTADSHYSQPRRVLWRGPEHLIICNLTNKATIRAAKIIWSLWKEFPIGPVSSWKRWTAKSREEENEQFKDYNDPSPAIHTWSKAFLLYVGNLLSALG